MSAPIETKQAAERARLALVESLALLDTPREPQFDAIADEAVWLTGYDTRWLRSWTPVAAGSKPPPASSLRPGSPAKFPAA
ncbi:MAG: hypothetical protein EXS38_11995 [Opitutus sp.]|nr:hypothetical protein [Opitutus sp.]